MTVQKKKYAELVAQAENAVFSVKDPELKRAAFEKVLDDLLAAETSGSSKSEQHAPRPRSETQSKRSSGPSEYIEELIGEKFFKKPKTISQVKAELANRGRHIPLTSLSGPLQKLCQRRLLRRHKAKTTGKKQIYNYSEW